MLDPVTLAVIQAGLQQVCDEMDLTFSRAAFSPVIAEANDRSDGIYAAEDGSLIAQGSQGLPVFVGVMQFSTRVIIERIARGETAAPEPDDVYIVNDPYLGGTHLMDVRFAMPFWRDGRIFCWLSNTGHWPDTGGAVPGGFSASATSAEQEGQATAGEAVQERGNGSGNLGDHPVEHPGQRTADRRCQGAGFGAAGGGGTADGAAGPLWRCNGGGGDCRNARPGGAADAGDDRADP